MDETFDSADGRFDGVTSIQSIQFPEPVPETREVAVLATTADRNAAAAQQAAEGSQALAIAGIAIGALGVLTGGLALARSRRGLPPPGTKSDAGSG